MLNFVFLDSQDALMYNNGSLPRRILAGVNCVNQLTRTQAAARLKSG